MFNLNRFSGRKTPPKYIKYKPKPSGSHLVNYKSEKDYDYYICDYCGEEIKINNKWENKTGGTYEIPETITKTHIIKLALHNKCLKPLLNEITEDYKD